MTSQASRPVAAGTNGAGAEGDATATALTGEIRTHYEVRGAAGPWLVLSHSLACDHTMWQPQIERLSRSFRVLAYDTRGHGRTSAPPGPYSLQMLADDLKALLDALSIESCHFVGLSMGGMIGQTFALAYPGVFASMVLCDTASAYPPDAPAAWEARIRQALDGGMQGMVAPTLERWLAPATHRALPQVPATLARQIEATPLDGYVACSRALVTIETSARLHELALPVLIVVGAQDVGTPPAMARAIHEQIAGSRLVVIDGAAHFPNLEQSAAFDAALVDFLDRQLRAGASP